jgi:hypothetical protein
MVKEIQDAGNEIAYHGTRHNFVKSDYYTDIPAYLDIAIANGINISGFVGPNGDFYEDVVFHDYFNTFKWARGGGSNSVSTVGSGVDYFKKIPCHFIDDLTITSALDTLKLKIDALSSRGTGVLQLSMHWSANQLPYVPALLDYIISKGIEIKSAIEAYEYYGAVIEYFDRSLVLGENFHLRQNGNGGTTNNSATPHFILQKDGTIISNHSMVKLKLPKKGNVAINATTLPNDFEIGISVIQYGSTDSYTGFPNVGTLYNFNFGKNDGLQFQLYKAYNSGGIWYREADTNNTWKSGMVNKFAVFRSTVPSSPTAIGEKGDFSADANYFYVCHATNAWIRIPKDNAWA